jgi:hypothetical protein
MGPVEAMKAFFPLDAHSKSGDSERGDGVHRQSRWGRYAEAAAGGTTGMGITCLRNERMAPGLRGKEGEMEHSDRIQNICSPVKVQAVHGL